MRRATASTLFGHRLALASTTRAARARAAVVQRRALTMSSSSSFTTLKVSKADNVGRVTLNRPEKRNAMNTAFWRCVGVGVTPLVIMAAFTACWRWGARQGRQGAWARDGHTSPNSTHVSTLLCSHHETTAISSAPCSPCTRLDSAGSAAEPSTSWGRSRTYASSSSAAKVCGAYASLGLRGACAGPGFHSWA
jgi:hypothetical protein